MGIKLDTPNLNQLQWTVKSTKPKHIVIKMIDNIFRRFLDIIISALGLIILFPLFIYIGFRIKRDSNGPIFFKGLRAGLNGKPFGIIKFRTMYENRDSYEGADVTAEDDGRITAFGKVLRDHKLNELPQLWNVFIGEMSSGRTETRVCQHC